MEYTSQPLSASQESKSTNPSQDCDSEPLAVLQTLVNPQTVHSVTTKGKGGPQKSSYKTVMLNSKNVLKTVGIQSYNSKAFWMFFHLNFLFCSKTYSLCLWTKNLVILKPSGNFTLLKFWKILTTALASHQQEVCLSDPGQRTGFKWRRKEPTFSITFENYSLTF